MRSRPPHRSHRPVVVVTRGEGADGPLSRALARRGFEVEWLPTIAAAPAPDPAPLEAAIRGLPSFDWVVFTSARAVDAACAAPAWPEAWASAPRRPRLAAVGPATAERLRVWGLVPALVPAEAGVRGLVRALAAFQSGTLRGLSVLWPRSDVARRDLAELLAEAGTRVVEPVAYRTVPAPPEAIDAVRRRLESGRIAAVAVLSPSAAAGLAAALGERDLRALAGLTLVASIGPTTSEALRSLGAPPAVEASVRTVEGLADALAARVLGPRGASP